MICVFILINSAEEEEYTQEELEEMLNGMCFIYIYLR